MGEDINSRETLLIVLVEFLPPKERVEIQSWARPDEFVRYGSRALVGLRAPVFATGQGMKTNSKSSSLLLKFMMMLNVFAFRYVCKNHY